MLRLLRTPVVQTPQMVRSVFCDAHGLWAKNQNQKVAQKSLKSMTARKIVGGETRMGDGVTKMGDGVTKMGGSEARMGTDNILLTTDCLDRIPIPSPKASPKEGQQTRHNPLSQRREVDPSRLKLVQERHKQQMAEVALRQQNAKTYVTRQGLHSGRQDHIGLPQEKPRNQLDITILPHPKTP